MDPKVPFLPTVEIFSSLQGEGYGTGTPMTFIRLAGCNLACPFCDTDHSPEGEWLTSLSHIRSEIQKSESMKVCITGGEPLIHGEKLHDLVKYLQRHRYDVHLETNGTIINPEIMSRCWTTISPKRILGDAPRAALEDKYAFASEVKVLVDDREPVGIDEAEFFWLNNQLHIHKFFQPVITPGSVDYIRNIKEPLKRIYALQTVYPNWRLSLQTHKLLNLK